MKNYAVFREICKISRFFAVTGKYRNSAHIAINFCLCLSWLAEFNTHIFRNSIFFKGPLLYFESTTANEVFTPPAWISFSIFKNQSKRFVLELQAGGIENDWKTSKFLISSIKGIRTPRRIDNNVDYSKYF